MAHRGSSEPETPAGACENRKQEAWARYLETLNVERPSDVLRRQLREVREAQGLTQRELAARMTAAGAPMDNTAISKIEKGTQRVTIDEAHVFAAVLGKPLIRLITPRPDEDVDVAVTNSYLLRPVELRNWIVFGPAWTPAARGAQSMFRLAYAARKLLWGNKEEAKAEIVELRDEVA